MINMSKQTSWFLIILAILVSIYFLFTSSQTNIINTKETSVVIRKKVDKKPKKLKKIYISPKTKQIEINSMKEKLKKKLKKIKKVELFDDNNIKSNEKTYKLKLFFADWCPHCVDFKPVWNAVKQKYQHIDFIDVDCTNDAPSLDYVQGFPTISLFNNEKHVENYENERSLDAFENYIRSLK